MISGQRYLAETLGSCGVTHFFHVPLLLAPAIKQMPEFGVQPIAAHSEKAAAYMADGYARASGRLGVCGAQAIGAANLAAGLLDALMARSPVLALSGGGTSDTRGRNTYQEIEQPPIYARLTRFDARVEAASRLPDLLNQAMRAATGGTPGPVHLELNGFTGGVLDDEVRSPHRPDLRFAAVPAVRAPADANDVARAAALLARAERPIVVAGSGIRAGGADDALRQFVERWQLPLATSLDAAAVLPSDDPLHVGVTGNYARDDANRAVAEADLILFAASTTGSMVTGDRMVARPGTLAIQIDVDPREVGRNFPLEVGLVGDPATVLDQLAAEVPRGDRAAWLDRIASLRRRWRDAVVDDERSDAVPILPQRLCRDLFDALPDRAITVVDTGHCGAWIARHLALRAGHTLLRAAGSLGWAYPASLGAKCAQPERPVLCFTGDGGFLYHMSEMETAMRYGINTVTLVNNNNAFSQEKPVWKESEAFDENWRFAPVSYSRAAEAFGVRSYLVEKPGDIATALRSAFAERRPVVVEVMTDPEITCPRPWRPESGAAE